MSKYNGWTNYETWLLNLNLTNEEGSYSFCTELYKSLEADESMDHGDKVQAFRDTIEEMCYVESCETYKICDRWTQRDWDEINFYEVYDSFKE